MNLLELSYKHLKYFFLSIRLSFMNMAEYRANFFSITAGTYGYMIISLMFLGILFSSINEIGGWNLYQVLMLFVVGQIIYYLYWSFIGGGSNLLGNLIITGKLDLFFLKPLNTVYMVTVNSPNFFESIPSFIFTTVLFIYVSNNITLAGSIGFFILTILLSLFIYYFMFLNVTLLSFWYSDTLQFIQVIDKLTDLTDYPPTIYPELLKFILFTVLPIGLLCYVPAVTIIWGLDYKLLVLQITSLSILAVTSAILWKLGVKNYSSASS